MRVNLGQKSKTPEARLPGIYTPGSYLFLSLSYPRLPPRISYLWQCLAFCLSQWVDSPRSPSPTGAMGFGWDSGRSRRKTALVWPLAISHRLTCVVNWSPRIAKLLIAPGVLSVLSGWLAGWGFARWKVHAKQNALSPLQSVLFRSLSASRIIWHDQ
ncbi:hypothetical protein ASPSYDRAFT_499854 [Aspergillus sydowii CBS 593.65]|uniref:Uncharacterized protein n=1 Tax=Aspergillus sydowii CBS 593.65 TaxID=1036612 RepID=A0A1L9T2I4_9EURO|nr:uncharacterized protein ASPSYDRAFT_499854 [Aspergillus sydowii CBS 593.65]OJJ53674.1 hypothetical protein ASPSYDRAFT_499854 [Aspergillus sydowii CBS 593.65]